MLSHISWYQFLIFLSIVIALYYIIVLVGWHFVKAGASDRHPVASPAVIREEVALTESTAVSEKPVHTPTGLMHELTLHLQQLVPVGYTRREILDSVQQQILPYQQEKMDMGRTDFLGQLKRTLFAISSITLTKEEEEAFWQEEASSIEQPLKS